MKEISVKLGVVFLITVIFLSINVGVKKDETIKGTETKEKKEEKEEKAVQVAVTIDNNVNYIDLDDYLLGVVAGEMPAKFEIEALKAQVVASRTFVYNRNLSVDNTTNSQVYLTEDKMRENWGDKYDEYHQKIVAAINDTNDEVMKYEGKYITAMFFSSSNGYTENVEDYFDSSALPYLRSVDCHWDLSIDPTLGSGHGVGMSQYGAQGMALEGASYKEILNHFYTNVEIVNN